MPAAAVGARLAAITGDEGWRRARARLIAGGKSNLTYEISSPAGSVIARRPPTGDLLPTAHDMAREARVQTALAGTPIPVPGVLHVDEQGADIGAPYYLMAKVPGIVVRDGFPDGFAALPRERREISDTLVDTLGALHQLDPEAVGLGGFGRPEGFMERQLRRWSEQWRRSRSGEVPVVEELLARLSAVGFGAGRAAVVHGDYRLDNCLLDERRPGAINAVLDWEMATLGDPLADLGMLLYYWCAPGEPAPLLTPAITAEPGMPDRAAVAERYAWATGADLGELPRYVAFAHLKFAVIAQGIARRSADGAMAGQRFGDLSAEVERVAAAGLDRLTRKEI